MLPASGIDDILYPMTADIYYAETKQNAFGTMEKTWVYNRTIDCSAISALADKTLTGELRTKGAFFNYNSDMAFRTNENIQKNKGGRYYPITEILITNIKDQNGNQVWTEGETEKTQYEVQSFVPSYNPFHTVDFYRGYLTRSQKQYEVTY